MLRGGGGAGAGATYLALWRSLLQDAAALAHSGDSAAAPRPQRITEEELEEALAAAPGRTALQL